MRPVPAGLVAWGRLLPWFGEPVALYVGEGVNASIAVTEEANGWRNFHVSGKVEASTEPQDMRLQRLLGHLTALMHEQGPKSVLVVGFGAGVTAGAISIHPSVERMVICELEPLIPQSGLEILRRRELRRRDGPEGADRLRRRAALHAHGAREVRRHHVGSRCIRG